MARYVRRGGTFLGVAVSLIASPHVLLGQTTTEAASALALAALAGTPLGAMLPAAPPMPTSRDDLAIFGIRGLYGWRDTRGALGRLTTVGAGADVQFQGRTMLSGAFGYQTAAEDVCLAESSCKDRRLMGSLRLSGNLVTTRPFLPVPFFTENSATGSAGIEMGAGWGSRAFGDRAHWSADVSVPLSLSVGQRFRVVPFAIPTLAMVWGTTPRSWSHDWRILMSGGLGIQEVGQIINLPGLDISFGVQRAFTPGGTSFGFTAAWTRVP